MLFCFAEAMLLARRFLAARFLPLSHHRLLGLCTRFVSSAASPQIQPVSREVPADAESPPSLQLKTKSNGRFYERLRENQQAFAPHLLLARVGDFYEFYFDQAETVSRLLGLKLARGTYRDQPHVFCGFPSYKLNDYVKLLLDRGHSVAKYEQYEKTQQNGQVIMERVVDRIYTPGTLVEDEFLESGQNHYLVALVRAQESNAVGFACVDVSTAEFYIGECAADELPHKIASICPREILLAPQDEHVLRPMLQGRDASIDDVRITLDDRIAFDQHFAQQYFARLNPHSSIAMAEFPASIVRASGGLLNYLIMTHGGLMPHLSSPALYDKDVMAIDGETQKSLELIRSLRRNTRQGSLLHLLDQTVTPLGKTIDTQIP